MSLPVSFSIAGTADAAILTQLGVVTFSESFGQHNRQEDMDQYLASAMNIGKITAELADPANVFTVAHAGGHLAGYAKIRPNTEPGIPGANPLELERIYVHSPFQGLGIGASLLQHIFTMAAASRHDVVWLGVWEHNLNAIRFYQRWGFECIGSHPFLLGTDLQTDVLMYKNII